MPIVSGSPSNAISDPTSGGTAWTTPTNAQVNDANNTTDALSGAANSAYLICSGYGFAIPALATINSVQVDLFRLASNGTRCSDSGVFLVVNGVRGGTNNQVAGNWPTGKTDVVHGGTDTWGWVLTPALVNKTNFGVAVSCKSSNTVTASVDFVGVTINYTLPQNFIPTTLESIVLQSFTLQSQILIPEVLD